MCRNSRVREFSKTMEIWVVNYCDEASSSMTAIKKAISLMVYQRKPGKETGRKSPSWVLTNFKACHRKLLLKKIK